MNKYNYCKAIFSDLTPNVLKKGLLFTFEPVDDDAPLKDHNNGFLVAHVGKDKISYAPLSSCEIRRTKKGKLYKFIPSELHCDKSAVIYLLKERPKEDLSAPIPLAEYYNGLTTEEALQQSVFAVTMVIKFKDSIDVFTSSFEHTMEQIYDSVEKQSFLAWYNFNLDDLRNKLEVMSKHFKDLSHYHSFTWNQVEKFINKHKEDFNSITISKLKLYFK